MTGQHPSGPLPSANPRRGLLIIIGFVGGFVKAMTSGIPKWSSGRASPWLSLQHLCRIPSLGTHRGFRPRNMFLHTCQKALDARLKGSVHFSDDGVHLSPVDLRGL
jgi:hypothetical protein